MCNKLLTEYKEYDYLNKAKENPLIKILVSYIKPSFLFKSEILTPIHLGRAVAKENSKDGKISDEDIKWLHENCIGDDDFEGNISSVNRRVGFLTGTYWAWKNYEKLGNPEYFGSFGYRRLLEPVFLEQLSEYDIVVPRKVDFKLSSLKKQIIMFHGKDLLNRLTDTFCKVYPEEIENLDSYLSGTTGYFWELYIFKREIFFDFCEWVFPLLWAYFDTPQILLSNNDVRDIGFIMERLTGYYCHKLINNIDIRVLNVGMVLTQEGLVNKNAINPLLLKQLRKNLK